MVKASTVLKLVFPYGTFDEAWDDKVLAKKWLVKRINRQGEEVQKILVLQKNHLLQNGYNFRAFFEPISEENMSLAMEALQSIVTATGCVELLTSEEAAEWLTQDALYKAEQTSLQNTVGNFDATTNLLQSIMQLHVRNSAADDLPCPRAKRLAEDMMAVAATSHKVAASRLKSARAANED